MTIHKWLGIFLSLWLLLITLTGTVLLYKNDLLELQYPQLEQSERANQKQAINIMQSGVMTEDERYVFVPTELHPWVEAIDGDGGRHYYSIEGELLLHRAQYGDWISWFIEFHHHLLLDDIGEELQGIFGLLTLVIFITGLIKWWPKGRWKKRDLGVTFSRPTKKKWGQTLWQSHRTLGVVLFLPMFLLILTGVAMIYSSAFGVGLNFLFPQHTEETVDYQTKIVEQNKKAEGLTANWNTRIKEAQKIMPEIRPIMVYLNSDRLRVRQPEEWHPNGRSYVSFHPETSQISKVTNYRNQTLGTKLAQKVYPLHIAEVGGLTYFTLAVLSGIALIWICISGVWFWLWCRAKKKSGKNKKAKKAH